MRRVELSDRQVRGVRVTDPRAVTDRGPAEGAASVRAEELLELGSLDRAAAIAELQRKAERGALDPEAGLRQLEAIEAMPHRFGALGVIGGHMVLTIGLALDGPLPTRRM